MSKFHVCGKHFEKINYGEVLKWLSQFVNTNIDFPSWFKAKVKKIIIHRRIERAHMVVLYNKMYL